MCVLLCLTDAPLAAFSGSRRWSVSSSFRGSASSRKGPATVPGGHESCVQNEISEEKEKEGRENVAALPGSISGLFRLKRAAKMAMIVAVSLPHNGFAPRTSMEDLHERRKVRRLCGFAS